MAHRDDRNQVKGFVAKHNTTFKLKHVKVLIQSRVINVAAWTNGNICIESGRISYLIPVCFSQSEITRTTCICLLQDQTLTEFTIGRSVVDSCLYRRVHEVTLPNLLVTTSAMYGRMSGEWVAKARATAIGSCAFSCQVFAPMALESSSHVARRSSSSFCHKLHTSFICWCSRPSWSWVIVYAPTTTTNTISTTRNRTTSMWAHYYLYSKHRGFLWAFWRVKFWS